MESTSIKIYGERNSGTLYLEKLIERNIDAPLLRGTVPDSIVQFRARKRGDELVRDFYFRVTYPHNLGWKHALVEPPERLYRRPAFRRPVVIVTVTKHPVAWALSMYRRPYHSAVTWRTFEEFLMRPWRTVGRENSPRVFANPIDMWNQKNRSYLIQGGPVRVLNLRYHDVLGDPRGTIETIRRAFGLRRKGDFENVEQSTKGDGKQFADYQTYYLQERWRSEVSDEAAAFIARSLDPRVTSALGMEVAA